MQDVQAKDDTGKSHPDNADPSDGTAEAPEVEWSGREVVLAAEETSSNGDSVRAV